MWKCIWRHITSREIRGPMATINYLAARQELKSYPSALLSWREHSTAVNSCKELSGKEKAAPTFCFLPCVEKNKRKGKNQLAGSCAQITSLPLLKPETSVVFCTRREPHVETPCDYKLSSAKLLRVKEFGGSWDDLIGRTIRYGLCSFISAGNLV